MYIHIWFILGLVYTVHSVTVFIHRKNDMPQAGVGHDSGTLCAFWQGCFWLFLDYSGPICFATQG